MTDQSALQGFEIISANLGFPRIGGKRELKKATESYWKGSLDRAGLLAEAKRIREENWKLQKSLGIEVIPSNDFSFYDQTLDMICLLGAVPSRYGIASGNVDLDTYFAMARGIQEKDGVLGKTVKAMEMTKWFDTNYHYIVPEFTADMSFRVASQKVFDEFLEAQALGITTRPVLIGPVTFLKIGKAKEEGLDLLDLLPKLLPVYREVLQKLASLGAVSVQIDEPSLVTGYDERTDAALRAAYAELGSAGPEILVATYFEGAEAWWKTLAELPVRGIHLDLVRRPEQLEEALKSLPADKTLSLGVVDGRNIWKSDLTAILGRLQGKLSQASARRIQIAPSCSLLHVPVDAASETKLDAEVRPWLAFAKQKLEEVVAVTRGLREGPASQAAALEQNRKTLESRRSSPRVVNAEVRGRLAGVKPEDFRRESRAVTRREIQRANLQLPLFPTTTIGSFPQTAEVRQKRRLFKSGELSLAAYEHYIQQLIRDAVRRQVEMDLDILVHGEFERNDMVEYFGEQLEGFVFTENGWVQSYGTRYVKPPVIFGDVHRAEPMTVDWFRYAQYQTDRPMKGMLTGPVTILQWSFVRDDQPRKDTTWQIALAIRDEVKDLEEAGARIIQIDEAAFREGLPLRRSDWEEYLKWAVDAFRLTSCGVRDEIQIHTHMCYSEFNDIIDAIAQMDADVISIETSRSQMELLQAFGDFRYPNDIGPGVYDIHSPRVPSVEEIEALLEKAIEVLPVESIWVNPDCGLKTRGWEETSPALKNMVEAAHLLRARYEEAEAPAEHSS